MAIERAGKRQVVAETGCVPDAAVATAAGFAGPIQAQAPLRWEALEGMARGSGCRWRRSALSSPASVIEPIALDE